MFNLEVIGRNKSCQLCTFTCFLFIFYILRLILVLLFFLINFTKQANCQPL